MYLMACKVGKFLFSTLQRNDLVYDQDEKQPEVSGCSWEQVERVRGHEERLRGPTAQQAALLCLQLTSPGLPTGTAPAAIWDHSRF